jgi:hypothetical protein
VGTAARQAQRPLLTVTDEQYVSLATAGALLEKVIESAVSSSLVNPVSKLAKCL